MSLFKDSKDPSESILVEFDFSSEMAEITTAAVSISIVGDGVDPAVASMLEGASWIVGTSVYQYVGGGVAGVNYCPRCEASHGSAVLVRASVLAVRSACA